MYDIPKTLQTRLIAVGGLNRFGEPNFRVVWGQSRLTWMGGEFANFDVHGNQISTSFEERRLPKYFPADRYYVEKWMPPEHYGSPENWAEYQVERENESDPLRTPGQKRTAKRIPNLGPYPSRGEYELSMRLEKPGGGFAPIVEECVLELVRMIKAGECHSSTENWLAIQRQQEKKDRDWNTYADSVLDDTNVHDGKPHIYLPNAKPLQRLSPRELKAIRCIEMGAKVQKATTGATAWA